MWWAGTSGPARFLVPLLLPLSVPAAAAWQSARSRGARVVMMLALAVTAWMAVVLAAGAGGFLAYHSRNVYGMTPAPWLDWANSVVALTQALPAFVPLPAGTPLGARMAAARDGFATTVPWGLCFAAAAYVTMWCGQKRGARLYDVVAASVAAFAVATMIAASAVWWMHGGHRVEALDAQLDVLRHLSGRRAVALDLLNARRVSGVEALNMRLDVRMEDASGAPAAMASIPLLPAGSYQISTRGTLALVRSCDESRFRSCRSLPTARGVTLVPPVPCAPHARAPSFAGASATVGRFGPGCPAGSPLTPPHKARVYFRRSHR